jgi:hypothetical protein
MFNDKPRLPTIDLDPTSQEVVRHFWELTEAIRALEEERDALIAGELERVPDGVRVDLPGTPVYLLRTRERLTASLADITLVEPQFLRPQLANGLAVEAYRQTSVTPAGVLIKKSRGSLSFRRR